MRIVTSFIRCQDKAIGFAKDLLYPTQISILRGIDLLKAKNLKAELFDIKRNINKRVEEQTQKNVEKNQAYIKNLEEQNEGLVTQSQE